MAGVNEGKGSGAKPGQLEPDERHAGDWMRVQPFVISIKVGESDIDGLNHSNNGCYVHWCEWSAWQHSKALGLDLDDYQRLDRAMAVRLASYDYLRPSHLGDTLLIATWLHDMTRAGMQRSFEIKRKNERQTILTAQWTLGCIEISTGKARRLPEAFKEVYGKAASQPENNVGN